MNINKNCEFIEIDRRCLGFELAKRRKLANVKQNDAAEWAGKTRPWLSQIECGLLNLSLTDAYNLCRLYGCDLMSVIDDAIKSTKEYHDR